VHFGDPGRPERTDNPPCAFEGPRSVRGGIHGVPSPGIEYRWAKVRDLKVRKGRG
jgi:hypothetical protein